jgi:hypothetical protein
MKLSIRIPLLIGIVVLVTSASFEPHLLQNSISMGSGGGENEFV